MSCGAGSAITGSTNSDGFGVIERTVTSSERGGDGGGGGLFDDGRGAGGWAAGAETCGATGAGGVARACGG